MTLKSAVRWLLATSMVAVGTSHFTNPDPFVRIVPSMLPAPLALVYISGVCEVLGGLGLCFRQSRRASAWGLIALYVAVFPANINMAINEIQLSPGDGLPVWAMWARVPLQAGFIAVAWWFTRPDVARLSTRDQ